MLELLALICAIMVSIAVYLAVRDFCKASMRRVRSSVSLFKSVNLLLRSVARVARVPVVPT